MLLALSFVPSLYNAKIGITLESGQKMLFLLLLQDRYSQCASSLFQLID